MLTVICAKRNNDKKKIKKKDSRQSDFNIAFRIGSTEDNVLMF